MADQREQAGRARKVEDLILELDLMARGQGIDTHSAQMVAIVEAISDEQWTVLAGNVTAQRLRAGDTTRCHAPSDLTIAGILRVYRARVAAGTYQLTGDDRAILREIEAAR